MLASENGQTATVELLIEKGATLEATNKVCSLHVHLCSRSVPAAWPY